MNPAPRIPGPRQWLALTLVGILISAQTPPAFSQTGKEKDLERIQNEIRTLQDGVRKDTADRDRVQGELREAEVEIARVTTRLKTLRSERAASEQRLRDLNREREDEELLVARERDALAGQLKAAYINGREERLKLLLNQQDPATLGRLMVYYGYLSRSRADTIRTVRAHVERLIVLADQAAAETRRLDELADRQQQRLAELNTARQQRSTLVATLDSRIKTKSDELERLREEERILTELIADLRRALEEFPVSSNEPFARLKGKLAWPVKGALLRDFGQPRADGRLKWNGVLVSGTRGSPVRAVYHGRVAFADWLPGMGLLMVIEHGDGFLSLYGHNETLLRAPGEWVAPGDVIASVGDSGGRAGPALYFEIRKGTEPQNPHRWMGARLSAR